MASLGERVSGARTKLKNTVLALASCVLLLPFASSFAQDGTSGLITDMVTEIGASVLAADQAGNDADKLDHYLVALDRIVYLKMLGEASDSEDGVVVNAAIADLATEGASADDLRSLALSSLYRILSAGGDPTGRRVEIESLIAGIESAPLRVSAYIEYAMLEASSSTQSALPLLQTATLEAKSIDELEARSSALAGIALAAASFDGEAAGNLSNQTIAEIWPARARGFARYAIARQSLDGELSKASPDDLASAAQAALSNGDRALALKLASAIDPEQDDLRTNALNSVLQAALESSDLSLFPILATAYADNDAQIRAISQLIANRLETDRLFDVIALTDYLPDGPSLASIEFALAAALDEAGLAQMASDAIARGGAVIAGLTGIQRDAALGQAIEATIATDKLDLSMEFFGQLADRTQVQHALRRLSKALADNAQIAEAKTVFDSLVAEEDIDYALSGIAQAEVKAGNIEAGLAALQTVTDPKNRGRVQAQLARAYSRGGQFEDALALAADIVDLDYGVQAYLSIAKTGVESKVEGVVTQSNDLALALAETAETEKQRWELTVDIVGSIAFAGDFDAAQKLADDIADQTLRAKALALLSQNLSAASESEAALVLLTALPASSEIDDQIAEGLVSLSQDPQVLEQVVDRVRAFANDRLRVTTFRAIAEGQLDRLDVYGHGQGAGESTNTRAIPQQVGAVVTTANQSLYSNGRFEALALPGGLHAVDGYGYPDLGRGVADLRREMPTPVAGNVSVTLANLSPYNGKFLEDLPSGNTGMQVAATAQGELQPRVIVVESGVYTLGQLVDELIDTAGFALVQRDGGVVTLRAPVIVGEHATLILSGQEASTYNLSATSGAFIAVAGKLYVLDTTVQSWDEATLAPRPATKASAGVFRPFFVGWSGSTINMGGSTFNALGYAAPKSFGLAFSAGPKDLLANQPDAPNPTGTVVDNVFRNFEYGFYSYEADDVYLVGNQYDDNVVYAIDPHDRSHRLVIGLNTTYGTQNKHGIIVSREVDNSWIVGNVSFDNHGSGLMLDRDSTGTLIYGNVAFANHQDGLTLFESSCNLIVGNDFFNNGRAGIKVRNSWDIGIYNNAISNNAEAGLESYTARIEETSESRDFVMDPYVAVASFAMADNDIAGNGSGLKVNGVSGYGIFGNNFQAQNGPLVAGDAKGLESFLIGGEGGRAIVSKSCLPARPAYVCPFRDLGIFLGDGQELAFSQQPAAACTAQHSAAAAAPQAAVSHQ
ncbi:poly(beta-D-mannuronate) C5 epimerase [Devosia psychrophila]|uniref:Poly(Beta-D-mannuronate) C5 epimerase n=1 Tax=Devosia psychrophila TaxID=728005 RepID=A0A1I1Q730_9HYPH|nr:poly(beta-D-mannuronate) C5 epimerase [Devosia psychrophila]